VHERRFVVKDPVTGIKTITNRISVSFVKEARNEDTGDAICRVDGTSVSHLKTLRMYAIQIPDSIDLQLPRSTIARLHGDPRVRWAHDLNVDIYRPADASPAQSFDCVSANH
jgi:hypothetical protein